MLVFTLVHVWQTFLSSYNGKSFFLDFKFINNQVLHLYTDAAASIGFGAVFDTRWFSGLWHEACKSLHITILEFYPILLAINIWGHLLQNKCLLFHSDNMAVVSIINKFSSKDPHVILCYVLWY